jgi:hypothetical protein
MALATGALVLGILALIVGGAVFGVLGGGFRGRSSKRSVNGGWGSSEKGLVGPVSPALLFVGALWILAAILIVTGLAIGAAK